jgi:hypothetical protein
MINPISNANMPDPIKVETNKLVERTISVGENGVSKNSSPDTYVSQKESIDSNYDVARYVQILKNMVIPPKDRFEASILLELELNNNFKAADIKQMIDAVDMNDTKKTNLS